MKSSAFKLLLFLGCVFFNSCRKTGNEFDKKVQNNNETYAMEANNATLSSAVSCDYNAIESDLTSKGWTKVFEDEFNNDGNQQWNVWTGGAYNNELQYYQAANLTLADGILSIAAKAETITGRTLPFDATPKDFHYTSGRIESKAHFSASNPTPKVRIMARLRLPAGSGLWPAFWSYGDPWPTQGEIDIMEARGNEPFVYHTAYWYGRRSGINQASGTEATITSPVSLMDCWHVYEVIWEKNQLTYLFDGKIVNVESGGYVPSLFRKSQRIVLNLAVGGNFFNPSPSVIQPGTMQADWVKVFTSK